MERTDLENYLGEFVEVKLFDGETIKGCLRKTHDEIFKNDPNLYIPKNRYFITENSESKICISCTFRTSHVKRVIKI